MSHCDNSDLIGSVERPFEVLADDTNQDKMRALITVFRPLRLFAAEYVS